MSICSRLWFVSLISAVALTTGSSVFAETQLTQGENAIQPVPSQGEETAGPVALPFSPSISPAGADLLDSETTNTRPGGIENPSLNTHSFSGASLESRQKNEKSPRSEQTPPADGVYSETSAEKSDSVAPEAAQAVVFSSMDVNRIVCQSDIKDVVYSKEKNVRVTFAKNNAFVKFLFALANGKEDYPKRPVEFFVICGDDVYNIIAVPKRVPAQTIRLSSGKRKKIRENASLFGGMPIEKKVNQILKYAYTDTIPDSIEVDQPRKRYRIFSDLALVLQRTAWVEGEGLLLKEFIATNPTDNTVRLDERQFLLPDLTMRTLAVAIDPKKTSLNKNESTRIFIVETREGGQDGRP
jgi:conjugal transfer pilus assembly protein TraK